MIDFDPGGFDAIIRVIQTSLTPIFLLTAIAGLLGVFTQRLARISDQVHQLSDLATDDGDRIQAKMRLIFLQRRSHVLDVAVILGALAGASTCASALYLFLGLLRAKATPAVLFILFGAALLCTVGALSAFLIEVLMASRGIRAVVERQTHGPEP